MLSSLRRQGNQENNRGPILCVVINKRLAHLLNDRHRALALELERRLDNAGLGCRRVNSCESAPIVDDESSANDVGSAVDGSGLESGQRGGGGKRQDRRVDNSEKRTGG